MTDSLVAKFSYKTPFVGEKFVDCGQTRLMDRIVPGVCRRPQKIAECAQEKAIRCDLQKHRTGAHGPCADCD
jgi:hypothetical protein